MTATTDRRTSSNIPVSRRQLSPSSTWCPVRPWPPPRSPAYGAWEDLMRKQVDLGQGGPRQPRHQLYRPLRLQRLRQERHRLARGAAGRVRPLRDEDTPDYGPRGCQKGMRHSKYMYGKQRVLYPMKRVGERGAGKWERISWDQAVSEIADKFIEHATESGPDSITFAMGTQMILKRHRSPRCSASPTSPASSCRRPLPASATCRSVPT